MTYSDGVLAIYEVSNVADNGSKPEYRLTLKSGPHYFGHEALGVTRYYQAMQADQQISDLVRIPDWQEVKTTDLVIVDDGSGHDPWEWDRFDLVDGVITYDGDDESTAFSGCTVFTVMMVQTGYDDDNLKMTRLTLERIEQRYELPG